jgi:hypothetical protein
MHRWPWQRLLLVHDHPPECVAKALPSNLHGLWIASREMLREALSRLAWAHSKAVEATGVSRASRVQEEPTS